MRTRSAHAHLAPHTRTPTRARLPRPSSLPFASQTSPTPHPQTWTFSSSSHPLMWTCSRLVPACRPTSTSLPYPTLSTCLRPGIESNLSKKCLEIDLDKQLLTKLTGRLRVYVRRMQQQETRSNLSEDPPRKTNMRAIQPDLLCSHCCSVHTQAEAGCLCAYREREQVHPRLNLVSPNFYGR